MSEDEKNRKISESIEPCPDEQHSGGLYQNDHQYSSPHGAWERIHMQVIRKHWQPRSWHTDETASAMLLERMPLVALYLDSDGWNCYWDAYPPNEVTHADRKTAIRDAYLAMIESRTK